MSILTKSQAQAVATSLVALNNVGGTLHAQLGDGVTVHENIHNGITVLQEPETREDFDTPEAFADFYELNLAELGGE